MHHVSPPKEVVHQIDALRPCYPRIVGSGHIGIMEKKMETTIGCSMVPGALTLFLKV